MLSLGESMKNSSFWLAGIGIILVIIAAGVLSMSLFASTTNPLHKAAGAVTVTTTTPVSSTGLKTFQIVTAQSTASYSVYENLIIQNKPNNDAIGTTHSVAGSFHIRTGTTPL